ncbi:MAG: NADH-quinone oxidoreductase subunit L [Firmicutes bacterium]|nr:NADH-quinone oxidoreductase subunit L [Bacillota bacterium]
MPQNLISATATAVFIVGPLLAILINNLLPRTLAQKICLKVGIAATLLQIAAVCSCVWLFFANSSYHISFSVFWNMSAQPGAARFYVDFLSLTVMLAIGLVSLVSLLTANESIKDKALNFSNLLMICMIGMNGLVMVNDLFSLYIFLEITGIAAFVLIALLREERGLEGAFKYLAMSAIASVFLLASLALIFMETGDLHFANVAALLSSPAQASQPLLLMIASLFFITAFSIKAAMVPFHGWLPDAYQSAPAAVSVLLGGIVTKAAGVYAIIRVLSGAFSGVLAGVFSHVQNVHVVFAILGLVSILYGAIAAIGQRDMKRMLAYSSISQMGYIVLGAATGSVIGLVGAALHFFNHATFKGTLFVNAAALEKQTGSTDLEVLPCGLQARMPLTAISSMLAFFSTAGIPPLAGFWSKFLIILAVWQSGSPLMAGLALLASIITAAYFLRIQRKVFFGQPDDSSNEITEVKGSLALAEWLLSIITVGCGLLFPALLLLMQSKGLF